jgi:mitochondrial import inner membrane translocase subunit TIM50
VSYQDLSYLNRDLSKVILLDTDPDHCGTHPENSIVIPKWKGAPGDRGLVAMIPFLECTSPVRNLVQSIVSGILTVFNFFSCRNIPTA